MAKAEKIGIPIHSKLADEVPLSLCETNITGQVVAAFNRVLAERDAIFRDIEKSHNLPVGCIGTVYVFAEDGSKLVKAENVAKVS